MKTRFRTQLKFPDGTDYGPLYTPHNIVCPYCKAEIYAIDDRECRSDTIESCECVNCKKTIMVQCLNDVSYHTYPEGTKLFREIIY